MKKWQIVLVSVVVFVGLIAAAGAGLYKYYVVPNYIEPALVQVTSIFDDDDFTEGITKEIKRLKEEGKLSGEEVEKYLAKHEEKASESADASAGDASESAADKTDGSGASSGGETAQTQSNLGMANIKVRDESSESSGSARTHYYKDSGDGGADYELEGETPKNTVSKSDLKDMSSEELYAKAKSIMSAADFSKAMALKDKVDISRLKALKAEGGSAVTAYLQEVLTESEYLDALDIYMRYENCLTE